jgi:hypothetical protein
MARARLGTRGAHLETPEEDDMSERAQETEERPANEGVEQHTRGPGGEGARNAQTSPPITQDAQPGQTSHPAPDDDVGVPSDEELAREEDKAKAEHHEHG